MLYNRKLHRVVSTQAAHDQWEGVEMPSQEDIDGQLQLLITYRRTLNRYLQQRGTMGGAYTPPHVLHGIDESRAHIRQIKRILRDWNVPVENHPDDEEADLPDSSQLSAAKLGVTQEYDRKRNSSAIIGLLALLITLSLLMFRLF
jgi:hypothetical protein